MLNPDAQILVRFALWLAIPEKQGGRKSEMHWVTPNWTWITLYTLHAYPRDPHFGPFRSTVSRFRDTTLQGQLKSEMHRATQNWT